jgi:Ca2+-dependent lipid-binding protein
MGPGKETARTKTVFKNLNPVYNEKFSLKASDIQASLQLDVYDHDLVKDKFIGRAVISLKSLIDKESKPQL